MKRLLGITALTAAILIFPSFARATDDNPPEVPKPEKKAAPLSFKGTVSAVDKLSKTITVGEGEKARVLQITSETRIFKNKKPATLGDVEVGDQVGGSSRKNTEGKAEITTLNVTPPKTTKAKEGDKKLAN